MSGGRFALVVAVDTFKDAGLRRLLSPRADAQALIRVLRDPNVGGFEVQELVNKRSYEISRAVEGFFSNRRRNDLLLLYYTGHGLKDDSGQLYFAMPDTNRGLLGSTALAARFVNELMSKSRSATKVLFLDCCHSGAFARGMASKADRAMHTAERFEGRGHIVLTASDAMQYAFEGDDLKGTGVRSVFTRFLIEGLTTGQADLNADGEVDIDELYDYVYERVITESPAQQPGKWAWDVTGRVIIAQSPGGATSLPAELQAALESAFAGIRLGAVEELGSLIRTTRDRRVVEAATAALQICAGDDSKRVSESAARVLAGELALASGAVPPEKASSAGTPAVSQPVSGPARRQRRADETLEARAEITQPNMALIPEGDFYAGLTDAQNVELSQIANNSTRSSIRYLAARPADHWGRGSVVNIRTFQVAKFPVTNGDYARFVGATGRTSPQHWEGPRPPDRLRDHPVVWVSWAAANAYCEWLRAETGLPFRLPSSLEWEKAARGTDGRKFPWGGDFDRSRCHFRARSTMGVAAHAPAGDSPFGISDMVGNSREWTAVETRGPSLITVRGGGFMAGSEPQLWCAYRDKITGGPKASIGFRVALS